MASHFSEILAYTEHQPFDRSKTVFELAKFTPGEPVKVTIYTPTERYPKLNMSRKNNPKPSLSEFKIGS